MATSIHFLPMKSLAAVAGMACFAGSVRAKTTGQSRRLTNLKAREDLRTVYTAQELAAITSNRLGSNEGKRSLHVPRSPTIKTRGPEQEVNG